MSKRFIDGSDFTKMILAGAQVLHAQVDKINRLNVFPVPDGDTGTNMNMTLQSGVKTVQSQPSQHIGQVAELFAKGLLMGARGNSGVILSQIYRGFAKSVAGWKEIDARQFAEALQAGVDTAYKAVVKPVEGTMLTVAREAAQHGKFMARRTSELDVLMKEVCDQAKKTLEGTPELLPALKQAGVVDSGGQGLVCIYEGFLRALQGDAEFTYDEGLAAEEANDEQHVPTVQTTAQANFATEEIEFPYDMEFFIHLHDPTDGNPVFDADQFREVLARDGDSILVIPDDDLVKVHVHTRKPGDVLNEAIRYGELSQFHIENMRATHRKIVETGESNQMDPAPGEAGSLQSMKPYGVVAISMGSGIAEVLKSIGVDVVLSGGQTMNPSTEDIANAVRQVHAEQVIVMPNNSNIIMAAQQVKDLVDCHVEVIPTKNIAQGIAAMFAFQQEASLADNIANMTEALQHVKSGQVTFAVRDSKFGDIDIRQGDFIGLMDNEIVVADRDRQTVVQQLLAKMIADDDEILTIFAGEDTSQDETDQLLAFLAENYPDVEVECHDGGQPLYYYIFSVE